MKGDVMKKLVPLILFLFLAACGSSYDLGNEQPNMSDSKSKTNPDENHTKSEKPSPQVAIGDPPADSEQPFSGISASTEVEQGDFIYKLYSEKEEYQVGELVKIYAELIYIGVEDEVTIGHAESPFYFSFYEHLRGYDFSHAMAEPYITQSIKSNKSLKERYRGQLVFGSGDDVVDTEFYKQISTGTFPVGEYSVKGTTEFNVEKDEPGYEPIIFEAEISFIVVE